MESFNKQINASPEDFTPKQEALVTSPKTAKKKLEEYVSPFSIIQEALAMYGIEVREKGRYDITIEGTLKDPEIKNKIYKSCVQELQTGNTYPLEFILSEDLLSKGELQEHGIREQKEVALKILQTMRGQQRARDRDSFIESGILTEEEASKAEPAISH